MKLTVKQVKPTEAELRRILKDREFAQAFAWRSHETKQKRLWELYKEVINPVNSRDKRIRLWSKMDKLGYGDWARKKG